MTSPPPVEPKTGLAKLIAGFSYALQGFAYAVRTQCNIRVHLGIAAAALAAALIVKLPTGNVVVVILLIMIVLAAELFNTAIETLVDLVSPKYHPLAKIAKDVSAAAVLVCAVGAVVIGVILFGEATLNLFM